MDDGTNSIAYHRVKKSGALYIESINVLRILLCVYVFETAYVYACLFICVLDHNLEHISYIGPSQNVWKALRYVNILL